MFNISLAVVVIMMLQFIPESPRFLYANKRYEEARKVLKSIAKFNKAKITPLDVDLIIFDTED